MGVFTRKTEAKAHNEVAHQKEDCRAVATDVLNRLLNQKDRFSNWKFVHYPSKQGNFCQISECSDGSVMVARGMRNNMPQLADLKSLQRDMNGMKIFFANGEIVRVIVFNSSHKDCEIDFTKPVSSYHASRIQMEALHYLHAPTDVETKQQFAAVTR